MNLLATYQKVVSLKQGTRICQLLRPYGAKNTPKWAFCVPACFNDALDIKKTLRKVKGESEEIWTQGHIFNFQIGDVLHSSNQHKANPEEIWNKNITTLQIDDITGSSESPIYLVSIYQPNKSKDAIIKQKSVKISASSFVRTLITGFEDVDQLTLF